MLVCRARSESDGHGILAENCDTSSKSSSQVLSSNDTCRYTNRDIQNRFIAGNHFVLHHVKEQAVDSLTLGKHHVLCICSCGIPLAILTDGNFMTACYLEANKVYVSRAQACEDCRRHSHPAMLLHGMVSQSSWCSHLSVPGKS